MRASSWMLTIGLTFALSSAIGACSDDGVPAGGTDSTASSSDTDATVSTGGPGTAGTMGTATTASTGTSMTASETGTLDTSGTDPTTADSSDGSGDDSTGGSSGSDSSGDSGSSGSSGGSSSSGGVVVVELDWGVGSTHDISINVGETVRWVWTDMLPHTVTSEAGGTETFDSGTLTGLGMSYEFTFDNVGSTDFLCNFHPASMTGTITVN